MEDLIQGFCTVLTGANLGWCFLGVVMGTLVGVLPGLGPVGAMSLLLPVTFTMDTTSALILLAGIYYGSMYGGSTTSILVNVPGEAASVITCLDGNKMAKQGKAGPALTIAAIGSFVAGTIGVVLIMLMAPALARAALKFGPPEYFGIALLGLLLLTRLTGRQVKKSYVMMFFGIALATVGMDPIGGAERFTFGSPTLIQGLDFIPVIMGLYGIAEVLSSTEDIFKPLEVLKVRFRELMPSKQDFKASVGPITRGTVLGFLIGLIPGPANIISTFVSYGVEKKLSKQPERFGNGAIEGVAGPETANNAACCGALVPLLSLGVPFSPLPAVLLGAFMLHNVVPGPTLIQEHPDLFWGLIASMYIGNVMLLVLNLPLVGLFARVASIPGKYLMPLVIVFCFIGAFSVRNSMFDLWVLVIFGFLGYFFRKNGYDPTPLALGMVLGPMLEDSFRQSALLFRGDMLGFFSRPLSGTMMALAMVIILWPLGQRLVKRLRNKNEVIV
ncbi:tripartite tricarboxylate transporter permease [Sporomusa sp.]|jgi:putative tricarboxylic transport membrane protein|uniref:tripartite tricarboxylate transporter permease n=1 Tax=Sporomusa sp. TaxID=2078658 RepID=UPI002B6D5D3D|nr:tripartite tricarboxylate transporter permease [Sporomusa sp.]MDF2874650.1 transporter [Sporomusa sp.]HWR08017.1 tripartite tricarboxylate transporter permease [Sporomusa sp.]